MSRTRLATVLVPLIGLFVLPCWLSSARAQQEPAQQPAAKGKLSAMALSARIDRHISARWRKEGIKAVGMADDATFFRRAHLDLVGKIPSILDIRDFLDDDRPDKRKIWVDKLVDSDAFADHFANVYREMMLPQVENQQAIFLMGGFENWLRKKFKENVGYDKLVRELLTSGTQPNMGRGPDDFNTASPAAFYAANEYKPENLAGATARLFLGVKIECAQCHKHPFADWTREQFWEFAVFFTNANPNGGLAVPVSEDDKDGTVKQPVPKDPNSEPTITIPKTDQVVKAKFLDGKSPKWTPGADPRKVVAEWITATDNQYFSRIAVNQMWHYFFGIGLVDPFDDFGEHNPASHPELLDELADQFVKSGYDLRYLARAIVNSKSYQLSSTPLAERKKDDDAESPRLFARMQLRALTGEQLFDSMAEVMEYKVDKSRGQFGLGLTPREEFVSKFSNPENKRIDTHSSILQALHLMNGKFMANATNLEKNKTLGTVANSNASVATKIETLYLVVLARMPRQHEMDRMTNYVSSGGPHRDQGRALADVMWVLLNSAEFAMNH